MFLFGLDLFVFDERRRSVIVWVRSCILVHLNGTNTGNHDDDDDDGADVMTTNKKLQSADLRLSTEAAACWQNVLQDVVMTAHRNVSNFLTFKKIVSFYVSSICCIDTEPPHGRAGSCRTDPNNHIMIIRLVWMCALPALRPLSVSFSLVEFSVLP